MSRKRQTGQSLARIESLILTVRGQRVILDSELAKIYGVATGRLNEQVQRNLDRFPEDFVFQVNDEEFQNLISQNAISSVQHGGRRKLPWLFTEHDSHISAIIEAIRELMKPPETPKRQIGFQVEESMAKYKVRKRK